MVVVRVCMVRCKRSCLAYARKKKKGKPLQGTVVAKKKTVVFVLFLPFSERYKRVANIKKERDRSERKKQKTGAERVF